MLEIFNGVGVALVTPFYKKQIDYISMQNLISSCLSKGAKAIVILGTTGEGSTISLPERKTMISFCKNLIGDKAKLVVGTGNNNFSTCLENTLMAKILGADAALVVTPYYNKTTQNGIVKYYAELAKIGIPLIAYNVPSRTGLNIEIETLKKMIDSNEWLYGIKESTCDINRIQKIHKICKDKIAVYSGEDDLNYMFYCLGSSGCISVTANVCCQKTAKVFEETKSGNFANALDVQSTLYPLNKFLFCETNPIPVKYVLKKTGLIRSDKVRLPLVPLSKSSRTKFDKIKEKY